MKFDFFAKIGVLIQETCKNRKVVNFNNSKQFLIYLKLIDASQYICNMRTKNTFSFLILFTLLVSVSSCVIETAKKPKNQVVTIYSDCIDKSEISIFQKFQKKEHIKVNIVHLSTDSILKKIARQGVNTSADVILFKSLFATYKAAKLQLFQPWKSWKMDELVRKNYTSKNGTWYGIGINPYVFVAKNDSLATVESIGDLFYPKYLDKWSSDLESSSELIPLFAPILRNKNYKESKEWVSDFIRNQHSQPNELDKKGIPIMTTDLLFTNYSSFAKMSARNDSTDLQLQLVFSNQNKRGAFYNLCCAGIVKQARNFENAKLLLEYIASAPVNEKLNNLWKTFPISLHDRIHPFAYQNTFFKIANLSSSRVMPTYGYLDEILEKTKKK